MSQRHMKAGDFNHFPVRARDLAQSHDVIIDSHGRPTAVLIAYERYRRLTATFLTPGEAIAHPGAAEIDIDFPAVPDMPRPADL